MTSPHTQMVDALGAADSFIHTIKIVIDNICGGEGDDYCALLLLADSLKGEIRKLHGLVEHMPEGK